MAIFCDQDSVLVLSSQTAISGNHGPPVPPRLVPGVAIDKNGLNCEGLIGNHCGPVTIPDGGHDRLCMKVLPDPMTHKIRADRDFVPVCKVVYRLQVYQL